MRKIRSTNIAGYCGQLHGHLPKIPNTAKLRSTKPPGQEPLPITWSAEDDTGQADASSGAGVRVVGHLAMHPGPRKPRRKQRNME